jgi:hypothetical protein
MNRVINIIAAFAFVALSSTVSVSFAADTLKSDDRSEESTGGDETERTEDSAKPTPRRGFELIRRGEDGRIQTEARQWTDGRRIMAEYSNDETDLYVECSSRGDRCILFENGKRVRDGQISEVSAKLVDEIQDDLEDTPAFITISISCDVCWAEVSITGEDGGTTTFSAPYFCNCTVTVSASLW